MRTQLSGTFLTHALGEGAWRLSCGESNPIDVYLRGADCAAAEAFKPPGVHDIGIEWHAGGVALTLTSADRSVAAAAHSAIVHEPLLHLYETLPLVRVDATARRFWRRVFRLVRIPGGRHVLRALALCSRHRD